MPLSHLLGLIFLTSIASSLIPYAPQDLSLPTTNQVSESLPIQLVPDPTFLPVLSPWGSQTPATPNETDLTYVTYRCDGEDDGHPLAASCQAALEMIPNNAKAWIFKDRATRRGWEVPLPDRVISRKHLGNSLVTTLYAGCAQYLTYYTADGKCFVEFSHDPDGVEDDLSSGRQMRDAASRLISHCVQTLRQGGQAKGIGRFIRRSITYSINVG